MALEARNGQRYVLGDPRRQSDEGVLASGVEITIPTTDPTYTFLLDVVSLRPVDRFAIYASSLMPTNTPVFPTIIHWRVISGNECALDRGLPEWSALTTLVSAADVREGRLVQVTGSLATRWTVWAFVEGAVPWRVSLSALLGHSGGIGKDLQIGSVVG